jgi:hypothetical protein
LRLISKKRIYLKTRLCNKLFVLQKSKVSIYFTGFSIWNEECLLGSRGRQGLIQTSFKVVLHKRHWCWPKTYFLPFLNLLMNIIS